MERTPELAKEVEKTLRAWGAITILKFRNKMRELGMSSRELYKSFNVKIEYKDGFPSAVSIGFVFHGRFADMGVGNGVKISDVKGNEARWKALPRKERKGLRPRLAKRWYSPIAFGQFNVLSVLLLRKYGIETGIVRDELAKGSVDIKMKL